VYEQLSLFNEAEAAADMAAAEPVMEEVCPKPYKRKKRRGKRKCSAMKRAQKPVPFLKGSIATPSLVAGIMNAKYVNGMLLARQETL